MGGIGMPDQAKEGFGGWMRARGCATRRSQNAAAPALPHSRLRSSGGTPGAGDTPTAAAARLPAVGEARGRLAACPRWAVAAAAARPRAGAAGRTPSAGGPNRTLLSVLT
ncbi:hypothetical protein GCM10010478_27870 [Streptomyces erythrogriseus]|uniref:Uncharacterized protein n=3 Tax=Streptomyces TaxID=1883 RepID=A0ABN3WVE2_9ACTN|nr:hypothetical protein GCM10010265_23780 [Streptomyces griseoincarnatus]GGT41323.1 hypothetical protein GCM10010287_12590 [Streptomyces variabilis]